ncbi:MAG: glycosyltransferase [Zetaproteobacteria bacterium]|nr:MAG: glycosyltransferase [Zetaproteobacteria bacterium]
MRVAFTSGFVDFVGGGEYSLFDLMTHLPENVTPCLLAPAEGELSARAEKEGIAWYAVPMPPIGLGSLPALWRWKKLISDIRPDVLHANNSRAAFYAGLIGKMMHVPVLFHCRVTEPDARLDRWLVRLVDGVIANSHATADRFSAWPGLKVWTVHNGVDVSMWHPVSKCKSEKPFGAEQMILVVARVSRWKRHDIALDVFEHLSETMPGLHLVCVGGKEATDVAWWDALQQRTSDLRNGDRVHWVGGVDHAALENWYATADVMVLPSDDEPFGRVLVEAMAMGVSIVAFDGGGVPEVVQHGKQGALLPHGDVDGMTAAVAKLLGDTEMRAAMGNAGRKRAKKFSVQAHVESMCRLYQELLHG